MAPESHVDPSYESKVEKEIEGIKELNLRKKKPVVIEVV